MSISVRFRAAVIAVLLAAPLMAAGVADAQSPAPPPEQQALTSSLRARSDGDVTIDRDATTGAVTFVGTEAGTPITTPTEASGDPAAAAGRFVDDFGPLFGTGAGSDLERTSVTPRVDGGATVRFRQVDGDVPVVGGELAVQVDGDGDVLSALGELQPRLDVATDPSVDPADAAATSVDTAAKAHGVDAATLTAAAPERWVYAPDLLGGPVIGGPRLVWRVEVTGPGTDEPIREMVLVDAATGNVALHFNQVASGLDRSVCDFNNVPNASETCTGSFVRVEGDPPTSDADIDNAYDFSGDTYDFFDTRFGRDSVDDAGLPLISAVRYCPSAQDCPFQNAFWNGSQMTYGDGFASADDVVGHELTHGVTEFSSGLFYFYQSGAINESLSDVFGEYMDLTNGAGNDTPGVRWQMGEDLPVFGAIRNMADPTLFGDPDKITSANYTADASFNDNGGVHTNSGVNNKAAFLMADGGTFNGHTVAALGITKAARVYYEAATTMLVSGSDYADLAAALPQACTNVIGTDGITSGNCTAVGQAVAAVEMSTNPPAAPTVTAPSGCTAGQNLTTVFSDDLENTASGRWTVTGSPADLRWSYPQNPNPYSSFGFDATYATSGDTNFYAADDDTDLRGSDTSIARTADVVLPAGASLLFNHAFLTESGFDGGRVEYSTNHGSTWTDAGPLFSAGGYTGHVNGSGGPAAFSGDSHGYGSSRVNLASLAGQSFRFRFRFTSDTSVGAYGWFVDDPRIISCQAPTGKPDAQIRIGSTGTFVGNDIYNTTGTGQTRSTTVGNLGASTFYARVQNDGNLTEPIKVKGTAGTTRFTVAYFAGTTNITSQVVAGTYQTAALAPGGKTNIKIVITARSGAPIGSTIIVKVKETSTTTTTAKDAVKATVTRNH